MVVRIGRLYGHCFGDFLAGILLGAGLGRINPWHAYFGIVAVVATIVIGSQGFKDIDGGRWVASVGIGWAAFQLITQIAAILGVVALGLLHGR
jgi:hypothetical protein